MLKLKASGPSRGQRERRESAGALTSFRELHGSPVTSYWPSLNIFSGHCKSPGQRRCFGRSPNCVGVCLLVTLHTFPNN